MKNLLFILLGIANIATAQTTPVLWQQMDFGNTGYIYTTFEDTTEDVLYLAGQMYKFGNDSTNIAKWDGSVITPLPKFTDTLNNTMIPASLLKYKSNLYVVANGEVYELKPGDTAWTNLFHKYQVERHPGIFRMQVYDNKLVLLGIFGGIHFPGSTESPTAATYDGQSFGTFLGLDTNVMVHDDATIEFKTYKNELYMSGNFNNHFNDIMRYDGTQWKEVKNGLGPNGMNGTWSLEVYEDKLWVGGFFQEPSAPGNCIAIWDGTNWNRIGNGISTMYAGFKDFFMLNNELYISFGTTLNDKPCNSIAKYKNGQWCCLMDNVNNDFNNNVIIFSFRDTLYASARVTKVNGDTPINEYSILKWVGGNYTYSCDSVTITPLLLDEVVPPAWLTIYPNPTKEEIRLVADAQLPKASSVSLYSMLGQAVKHYITIPSSIPVQDLPSGAYHIVIQFEKGYQPVRKVIVVK